MTGRALVTGAGGFVGSHFVETLLALTDWDVVAVTSFCHNGTVDRLLSVTNARPESCDRLTVVAHDLTVPLSPRQRRAVDDVHTVFHVASRSSVDQSIAAPVDFIRNNVLLTLTTLELARELDVTSFVYFSTDEVYGPHASCSPTDHRPSSPYSASKAAQEDICHAYARTYGLPLTIVNSGNMFGERQSQLALVPRVIRYVLADRTLPVHTHAGEVARRAYSYVSDVAARVIAHVTTADGAHLGRLPLAGRYPVTVLELARRVAALLDRPLRYELVDGASVRPGFDHTYELTGDPDDPWLDARDAPLDDRLHRTVTWFASHPEWLE